MGSGRDKRKKKNKVPGAGAIKTAQHTERNAVKQERRIEKQAQVLRTRDKGLRESANSEFATREQVCRVPAVQGGEDDLDALLARFKLQDAVSTETQILECSRPPSPRLFATFTPVPAAQASLITAYLSQGRACT